MKFKQNMEKAKSVGLFFFFFVDRLVNREKQLNFQCKLRLLFSHMPKQHHNPPLASFALNRCPATILSLRVSSSCICPKICISVFHSAAVSISQSTSTKSENYLQGTWSIQTTSRLYTNELFVYFFFYGIIL